MSPDERADASAVDNEEGASGPDEEATLGPPKAPERASATEGTEGPSEAQEAAAREAERRAAGPLRRHPGVPTTTWNPPGEGGTEPETGRPRREVGDLDQRAAARRRDDLRRVQGMPSLQAVGWILFILGGLIYLHGLWATANATLTGSGDAEQVIAVGGATFLEGTLGITLALIGLIVGVVFTFAPVRLEPPLHPGTLEFEVAAENLRRARDLRRILTWSAVGVFVVGLALAAIPLKESITDGSLYTVSLGGNAYRIHFWGYLLAAVGAAVAVPLAVAQGAVDRAAALAEGALEGGRVRRAMAREPAAEGTEDATLDAAERRGDGMDVEEPGHRLGPPRDE